MVEPSIDARPADDIKTETREPVPERMFTPTFFILSFATLCFFCSQTSLVPVLPRHLEAMGANSLVVGLVVGSMLFPAVVLRPLVGKQIDRRGRKLFILIGLIVGTVCSFGYSIAPSIPLILVFRLFHGAAMACFYPGAITLSSDLAPKGRRAAALSYFSMFLFAGAAIGPAIGEGLYQHAGADAAFLTSAAIAFAGICVAIWLKDRSPRMTTVPDHRMPLLNRAALFPALVLSLVAFAHGGADAFVPLYVSAKGNGDSRVFFSTLAITILLARIFVGRVADKHGRAHVIIPGTSLIAVSMFILATSASTMRIAAAAIVFGLGWGLLFPGLFALTMDRVGSTERGSATGTLTAALDLMFGAGQVLLGWLLLVSSFSTIFIVAGLVALAATVVFVLGHKTSALRFPVLVED